MRGQLYTIAAVVIITPLLLFTTFYIANFQLTKAGIIEKVVADQEHQLERSVESDVARALAIGGRRALLALTNDVVTSGEPAVDATASLLELMENGTLDGVPSTIMEGNALPAWRDAILNVSTGFNLAMDYSNLSLGQHDSFNLLAGAVYSINVSDNMGVGEIIRLVNKEALVDVEGVEDPMFPLSTQGYLKRTIAVYPYSHYALKLATGTALGGCEGEVSFDAGSPDSSKILVTADGSGIAGFGGVVAESGVPATACYLTNAAGAVDLINDTISASGYNRLYIDQGTSAVWSMPIREGLEQGNYYPEAGPGMLERLEGNFTPSSLGMQTFISVPELEALAIPVKENQTRVAYLYFSEQDYNGTRVRGLQDWFRIDPATAALYNLTELLEA